MRNPPGQKWLKVDVHTTPEAFEAVSHVLIEEGASGVEEGVHHLIAYFPYDNVSASGRIDRISQFLARLSEFGVNAHPNLIDWSVVSDTDWADSWKQHFHPLRLGERIVIRPTWRSVDTDPEDVVVDLDPGMAFGTGIHPTTRLCA